MAELVDTVEEVRLGDRRLLREGADAIKVCAIVAGTRTAAELLGLADELGTIQAGKIADLIVCAGDPLADITLLGKPENVVAVVQAGVVRKNTMPTI
jgi:cytosine/adenosine deaminase-related metal-dependent hydrolase